MRILLVDDYELVRDTLSAMLEQMDHTVTTASSASEALQICRSERPQVVFTDYALTGINGVQLARQLKEIDAALPVVLFTGSFLDLASQQLKNQGVDFVLHKPFGFQEVEEVLSLCGQQ